jgi:hypothetical protein
VYTNDPIFADELLTGETILWQGQPDPRKWLSLIDLFLIPFTLFWDAITLGIVGGGLLTALHGHPEGLFMLLLPHFWIALYLFPGRFFYAAWRKHNTFYAVTHKRVLIMTRGLGGTSKAIRIENLAGIYKGGGQHLGNVTFDTVETAHRPWWQGRRYSASQAATYGWMGAAYAPGFYDVPQAGAVYRLVNELRDGQSPTPILPEMIFA